MSNKETIVRDRTYKEIPKGDYLNDKQYMGVATSFLFTHICMELLYSYLKCTPMIYINIFSILSYVVCIILIKKERTLLTAWIMELEVYLHVICATVFLGFPCGFYTWLFAIFCSVFLPYSMPQLSKAQRRQITAFGIVIVITMFILSYMDNNNLFPTQYRVSDFIANNLFYLNSLLSFSTIMIYTSVYNVRMTVNNDKLEQAANFDYLTVVFNRQRIQKILSKEAERANEMDKSNLYIAILDIDFFKKINDTYGHSAGDEALKSVSSIFHECSKRGLITGRWGGEEFLLISPDNITYESFNKNLDSLRQKIESQPISSRGKTFNITVSIGSAKFEKGMSDDDLIHIADDRLYQAKAEGRNRVVC